MLGNQGCIKLMGGQRCVKRRAADLDCRQTGGCAARIWLKMGPQGTPFLQAHMMQGWRLLVAQYVHVHLDPQVECSF